MPDLSLISAAALFAVSAFAVWQAGARLAYLADALADRFHLGKSIVGLVALSTATSLPEIATTLSAAVKQSQDLVLNNLFGGVALQTAILAMADFWARGAITNYPRSANHALEAALLNLMLGLTIVLLVIGGRWSFGWIGLGSVVIALVYAGAIWLLRRYDRQGGWVPVDLPDFEPGEGPVPGDLHRLPSWRLLSRASAFCALILVFGVGLVISAEAIATQSGLGASFVGVTFLAAATSLPELTTSIAAVRIGAYTLAISNIFGSNLIMIVLVFPADLLYTRGPILHAPTPILFASLGFGILVTSIFLIGLIVRRKPRLGKVGLDSVLVLGAFVASLAVYFALR
ncbi:cation:H+ antiporter [Poseidonocella sedimentorum]|uniref:Cation:H+ antiporter n=2 Tax=Poseidonocella sedimentorum TaxID=871652 RepID=A0A1I6DVX5_9RHOB|nr:cation:H+ antiporter [Poseidonocella sedimentorum]